MENIVPASAIETRDQNTMLDAKTIESLDGLVGFLPPLPVLQKTSRVVQDCPTSTGDTKGRRYRKGKYLVLLFIDQINRAGSEADLNNLRVMFEGHQVLSYIDFDEEKTFDQALADAQDACKLNNFETLVVYFGMHGGTTSLWNVTCSDLGQDTIEKLFSTERVRNKFLEGLCKDFEDKAKVFINDQCRHDITLDRMPDIIHMEHPEDPGDKPEHLVQIYSTQSGCKSNRDSVDGTFLIQKLSEVLLDLEFRDKCLTEIMDEVQKRVKDMADGINDAARPQVPTCSSTLTKELVHTTPQDLKDMQRDEEWRLSKTK